MPVSWSHSVQVPQIYVFLAGELLIAFIGVSAFLFLMLLKSYRDSRGMLGRARQRIEELREFESRHDQAQQNLQRFMKGFAHLKSRLSEAEAANEESAAYQQRIAELEQENHELRALPAQLEAAREELDALRRQAAEREAGELIVEADDEPEADTGAAPRVGEYRVYEPTVRSDQSQQEIDKLRSANDDKIRMIRSLRERLGETGDGLGADAADELARVEHMLHESETCVTLLENELSTLQQQLHDYEQRPVVSTGPISQEELDQLQGQLDSVNEIVVTMMKANGDQSNLIAFSRRVGSCESFEELGDAVLATMDNFGLSGSVQIRSSEGVFNRSHHGHVRPADLARLSDLSSNERFEQDGAALLVRYEQLSMLVDQLPPEETEQSARFKDNLAIAMELAVAEVSNLERAYDREKQQANLKKLIASTLRTMQRVEEQFQEQATESKQLMDSLSFVMENEQFTRSMQPEFQKVFRDVMGESKQRFDDLYERGLEVNRSFMEIIAQLGEKQD